MGVVNDKVNLTVRQDVKVVTRRSLLDNDRTLRHFKHFHGLDKHEAFLVSQTGEDKVLLESGIDEIDNVLRLGNLFRLKLLLDINSSGKDFLGTLLAALLVLLFRLCGLFNWLLCFSRSRSRSGSRFRCHRSRCTFS